MLQQGAMALASFHGKLSQPLKRAHVPPVHSSAFPLVWLASSSPGTGVNSSLAGEAPFPHASIAADVFISNYVQMIRVF